MPHRKPACLIGDRHAPSETDMPHWRPKFTIGNQHACVDPSDQHACVVQKVLKYVILG